ncbi:MAG: AarF/ABC1/UbiB kinase family protein [Myxococcaceae bacterium]|nr:AarF/ABC1/UbiB kinase family protein [Myxococcaceae bacterium]
MAGDDDYKPSTGRFKRLAKLATLSAKLSTDVGARVVKRFANRDGEDPTVSLLGHGAAEKLVATLGDLKGLAMKIGQGISMDPDLLTPEIRAVVAKLQNQAPPMPWPTVKDVITKELGRPPDEAYASFEQEPVASASLGQVHRAVTKDGTTVAVKVQYPDIARAIHADLDNLGAMVTVVATTSRMPHGKDYFREVQQGLLEELDYEVEAERSRKFASTLGPFPDLKVPRVFDELTAERVLTLEYFEGETLKEFIARLDQHTEDEKFRIARLLTRMTWGPFLCSGVVHADPHPGNFMLLKDGTLGVLDYGAIKQMSEPWTYANRKLFVALMGGPAYDPIADSAKAGMVFENPEAARPFVATVLDIACRAVRTDEFDYAEAAINRDMRNHFLKNALSLGTIKPPKEAVQFFRAVAGMSQNLENLKAKGPFRSVFAELHETVTRHGRPLSVSW